MDHHPRRGPPAPRAPHSGVVASGSVDDAPAPGGSQLRHKVGSSSLLRGPEPALPGVLLAALGPHAWNGRSWASDVAFGDLRDAAARALPPRLLDREPSGQGDPGARRPYENTVYER